MEQLINDLKLQIKEALNLEELSMEDFDENAPLFGDEGIGLDSIDVLEIIVLLEKNYGIRLASPKEGKAIFKSVKTIAEYVQANRKK
ncbi:MAG: acyl carrier protein [Bacteroidaceae bacterium]|nr:acyl carrier protein [Bacteroidaceae bacterium]